MKNKSGFFLSALLFLSFLSPATAQSKEKIIFTTTDIYNNEISESIFENSEITMINVWGTFCGPCIKEMPDLAKLNSSYDLEDFQVVGIVIDVLNRKDTIDQNKIATAKRIAEVTGAQYIHIIPEKKLLRGLLGNVYVVPTTFFVNKKGELVDQVYTGSRSFDGWKSIVDMNLKNAKK